MANIWINPYSGKFQNPYADEETIKSQRKRIQAQDKAIQKDPESFEENINRTPEYQAGKYLDMPTVEEMGVAKQKQSNVSLPNPNRVGESYWGISPSDDPTPTPAPKGSPNNPEIWHSAFLDHTFPIYQQDNPVVKGLKAAYSAAMSVPESAMEIYRRFALHGGSILAGNGLRNDLPETTSFTQDLLPQGAKDALNNFEQSHPVVGGATRMGIETLVDPTVVTGNATLKMVKGAVNPGEAIKFLNPEELASSRFGSAQRPDIQRNAPSTYYSRPQAPQMTELDPEALAAMAQPQAQPQPQSQLFLPGIQSRVSLPPGGPESPIPMGGNQNLLPTRRRIDINAPIPYEAQPQKRMIPVNESIPYNKAQASTLARIYPEAPQGPLFQEIPFDTSQDLLRARNQQDAEAAFTKRTNPPEFGQANAPQVPNPFQGLPKVTRPVAPEISAPKPVEIAPPQPKVETPQTPNIDPERAKILDRLNESIRKAEERAKAQGITPEEYGQFGDENTYLNLIAKRDAIAAGAPYKVTNVTEDLIKGVGAQIPRVNQNVKGETIPYKEGSFNPTPEAQKLVNGIHSTINDTMGKEVVPQPKPKLPNPKKKEPELEPKGVQAIEQDTKFEEYNGASPHYQESRNRDIDFGEKRYTALDDHYWELYKEEENLKTERSKWFDGRIHQEYRFAGIPEKNGKFSEAKKYQRIKGEIISSVQKEADKRFGSRAHELKVESREIKEQKQSLGKQLTNLYTEKMSLKPGTILISKNGDQEVAYKVNSKSSNGEVGVRVGVYRKEKFIDDNPQRLDRELYLGFHKDYVPVDSPEGQEIIKAQRMKDSEEAAKKVLQEQAEKDKVKNYLREHGEVLHPFNEKPSKPTPASMGFTKSNPTWFKVKNKEGWVYSNGHILDLTEPNYKEFGQHMSPRFTEGNAPNAESIIPKDIKKNELTPLGVMDNIVYSAKKKANEKIEETAIFKSAEGKLMTFNKAYIDYFRHKYKGATFHAQGNEISIATVHDEEGNLVGLILPTKTELTQSELPVLEEIFKGKSQQAAALEEIRKAQGEMAAAKTEDPEINRLAYPDTLASKASTPPEFKKALTQDETEFLYEVKHNEDTIEKAREMLSRDNRENTQLDIMDPDTSLTVEQVAAGQILIKRALAKGDYENAKRLTEALARKAKTDGQKIQILAAYGKTTPEGIIRFAEGEIEKARTPKQNKQIEEYNNWLERELSKINIPAADEIGKEIEDDLPNILDKIKKEPEPTPVTGVEPRVGDYQSPGRGTGSSGPNVSNPGKGTVQGTNKGTVGGTGSGARTRNGKPRKELTPEEMLARRVASTLADPKKRDDPVRDMVNILYKVALESSLPDNRIPHNPLELVVKAIKNKEQYRTVWNKAKGLVEDKFKDNPEALDQLQAYFDKNLKPPFPQKELNKAVDQGLKSLANDVKLRATIAQVVREHYSVNSAMRTDLVNRLVKQAGLKYEEAQLLEKYVRNRMKELTKEKKEKILASMFKERPTPKTRTIVDKIIEMSNLGGFQHNKYKDLVAAKLGFPNLSEEGLKSLHAQAQAIQTMAPGEEKSRAIAKMFSTISAEIKPTIGQKVATIQTMAQLLNPKTAIRNLVGNVGLAAAEGAADIVGTGLDKLISLKTGKRTVDLPSISTQYQGMKAGAKAQARDIKEGINTFAIGTKHDLPRMKTFRSGILGKLEDAMNYELRVPDRAFYEGARQDSLRQQMKLAGVTKATPEMEAIAEQDALYRTLQDENTLSKAFTGLKKTLNLNKSFGAGDFIIKYPKTPANILNRGIDFSPAGFGKLLFKTISEVKNEGFNQRNFVKGFSRALVGTAGLTGVGVMFHKLGIMTGSPDEHIDVAALERQVGAGEFKINVSALARFAGSLISGEEYIPEMKKGDNLVSYDWFQPNAIPLAIGADIDKNQGEVSGWLGTLWGLAQSSINAFSDQPVMQGVEQLFRYGNVSQGVGKMIQGVPASFWPTIANQMRQMTDNQKRSTYDPSWGKTAAKMVQNKIPFAEASLPKVYDTFGKADTSYKKGALGTNNPFNVMVNPAFTTQYNPTPEEAKALKVFKETGNTAIIPNNPEKNITDKGKKIQLTPEQYSRYQQLLGEASTKAYQRAGDNLSAKSRQKLLENYLTQARTDAREKMLREIKKQAGK